ncbi:MAG: S-layer homology domain-containing protein, partial [Clostridiales bacterium]|nr:S-layer homology domain-containing protein [Clostridiales bacterium]
MKRFIKFTISMFLALTMLLFVPAGLVLAREGDSGYEGGISSGENAGKTTFDYQEVCFITGEPIVFKGTLVIKKQKKSGKITSTYTYSLTNTDKSATLVRVLYFTTTLTTKENGQIVETTVLTKAGTETIKIGSTSYTLKKDYDFTRSCLIDPKPAVNYYAGNIWSKKIYTTGTSTSGGTVTVEATGSFYGYDQYWGTTEFEAINYTIESAKKTSGVTDKWGGTAKVNLSSSMTRQLKYIENEPEEISFDGGYLQTQNNKNILEYTSKLPVFDSSGAATDNSQSYSGSMQIETFPVQTRLPATDLSSVKGHWAEQDIGLMFGLEIFTGSGTVFKPEQYITRAEFAAAINLAAKTVPEDPAFVSKTTAASTSTTKKTTVVSPFDDVSIDNTYFDQINSAYKRGLITGKGANIFGPNESITLADALTIFIRAIGLESMAPSPTAVTSFKDNDLIPASARNAAYVAEKIGLIQGDTK